MSRWLYLFLPFISALVLGAVIIFRPSPAAVAIGWRFGQNLPVDIEVFTAESEGQVLANIKRKEAQHHEMSDQMVEHMKDLMQHKFMIMLVKENKKR